MLVRSLSPVLGHKVLYAHALSSWSGWVDPGIPLLLPMGPRSSSLMTSWVPGSLASCCLFLAVDLGRCNRQGPIKKSPSEGETPPFTVFCPLKVVTSEKIGGSGVMSTLGTWYGGVVMGILLPFNEAAILYRHFNCAPLQKQKIIVFAANNSRCCE